MELHSNTHLTHPPTIQQPQAVFTRCFSSANWDPRGLYSSSAALTSPPSVPLFYLHSPFLFLPLYPPHPASFPLTIPPCFISFSPCHSCHFFNLSAYSFLFFSAWLFAPNELNSVYSQGRVNCDAVLKCSPRKESRKWPKQSAAVGFKCICGITTSVCLVPLTFAVFSHYLTSLMPLSFLLLFPHL